MPNDTREIQEGMLWFDDDPDRTLQEKIKRADRYYRGKYGPAQIVVVSTKDAEDVEIDGLIIEESSAVQPNHLWIGQFEGEVKA